jgi:uncharacterized protein
MELIQSKIKLIKKACKNYFVNELYLFGSALTKNFNEKSDIDLIVDFKDVPREDYVDNYFDLKYSLENILKRRIDLLEDKAIKNPYLKEEINSSKEKIYG